MINREIYKQIKYNFDHIAKPIDSLGYFEEIFCKIGAVQGKVIPDISKRAVVIMCADNGIIEEGVSQSGNEVTFLVAENMGKQASTVGLFASKAGVGTIPVDIGMASENTPEGVINRKISRGTRNFAKEPAMDEASLNKAIEVGREMARLCRDNGMTILATGEMGIGNTTTSAAVVASILKLDAESVVGRGAGLDSDGLARKVQVVADAIKRYDCYNLDAKEILKCVGGYDIAGLTGLYLECAGLGIPVVVDGVISATAALAACEMDDKVKDILIASHCGKEPAISAIFDKLELRAVIDADLALGEGTGAVMLFPLLDMVHELYVQGSTFKDLSMDDYIRLQ